jgi:hypothetical protein
LFIAESPGVGEQDCGQIQIYDQQDAVLHAVASADEPFMDEKRILVRVSCQQIAPPRAPIEPGPRS